MARARRWTPKRNRSEDDRNKGAAGFIDLDEGQNFLGHALFEGDPSKDEIGYYEFQQHWVPGVKGGTSVPCAGEDCPYCEEGDKPRDVAYTAWLVLKDAKGNTLGDGEGEVLSFRANSIVIKQITEMRGEDEPPLGVQFRMSRLDDRGNYIMASKPKKALTKTQIKELLKESGIDYDTMVTNRLNKAMEGLSVARALDDEDEDEETNGAAPARGKTTRGKAAKSSGEEWPAKTKSLDVTVESVDEDGNFVMVENDDYDGPAKVWTTPDIDFSLEELEEGADITIAYTTDGDGDFVLSTEPVLAEEPEDEDGEEDEAGGGAADNDLPDELEDEEFEVVSIDKTNSTMDVKSDALDLEFTLYFLDRGPAGNVDFDDYEEGNTIVVSAEKDTVGDMVATVVPAVKEEKAAAKKTTTRRTTTRKTAAPAGKGRAR